MMMACKSVPVDRLSLQKKMHRKPAPTYLECHLVGEGRHGVLELLQLLRGGGTHLFI